MSSSRSNARQRGDFGLLRVTLIALFDMLFAIWSPCCKSLNEPRCSERTSFDRPAQDLFRSPYFDVAAGAGDRRIEQLPAENVRQAIRQDQQHPVKFGTLAFVHGQGKGGLERR